MSVQFYLFDVDHGQSAALHLPNGRWCIFDLGATSTFSPVNWIVSRELQPWRNNALARLAALRAFKFLIATVSHLHGDHLADWQNMTAYGPEFIRSVQPDQEYLQDCRDTNTDQSWPLVLGFAQHVASSFSGSIIPDYGGVMIRQVSLPVGVARQLGGDANARVNNSSIVTRIDVYGNSILLCGDMMKEAWKAIISDQGQYGREWRPFLSNIDLLVAPHHGHRTAFSIDLLNIAKPAVVLVSVVSNDPNVDSRYSQVPVRGIKIGGTDYSYISTRQKGHIKVTIEQPRTILGAGTTYWKFGDEAL